MICDDKLKTHLRPMPARLLLLPAAQGQSSSRAAGIRSAGVNCKKKNKGSKKNVSSNVRIDGFENTDANL
jgi:hypothetical protein